MKRKTVQTEPATLPPEIWKAKEVMDYLKVGRTKFYELLSDGLPSRKIGGSRRFDPRDVAKWWQEQESA